MKFFAFLSGLVALIHCQAKDGSNRRRRDQESENLRNVVDNSFLVYVDNEAISPADFARKVQEYLQVNKITGRDVQVTEMHHLFKGALIQGLTKEEVETFPNVLKILPDNVQKFKPLNVNQPLSVGSYGLDRLDEYNLPLDGEYKHFWSGSNVDVYIVDKGIDTSHAEFRRVSGSSREVKNVYDAFMSNKNQPNANNDLGDGHGTHVAGIVGGNTLGVSPGVNLYGVRIFDSSGSSSNAIIAAGLERVVELYNQRKRRAVVNMSLGSTCGSNDCSDELLSQWVNYMSSMGIIVAVSAGNEGCNACHTSPAAASSAITVAASDAQDIMVDFSNFGRCVDITAPGANIVSACNYHTCGNYDSTQLMSGTSMASPHVAGIIAQILEKLDHYYMDSNGNRTPITHEIVKAELSCASAKNKVRLNTGDTITKNLLLSTPNGDRNDDRRANFIHHEQCYYNSGCDNSCSSKGVCLKQIGYETPLTNGYYYLQDSCYCDKGYYGYGCTNTQPNTCNGNDQLRVDINKFDSQKNGWNQSKVYISDKYGMIVDNAFDSMCYGERGITSACLSNGIYELVVTKGEGPREVVWQVCDNIFGSAPYQGLLEIKDKQCYHRCPSGYFRARAVLHDSVGDGWGGAYFVVKEEKTGEELYGGTFYSGYSMTNYWCLTPGHYPIQFIHGGKNRYTDEVSLDICGATITPKNGYHRLVMYDNNTCRVESYDSSTKSYRSASVSSSRSSSTTQSVKDTTTGVKSVDGDLTYATINTESNPVSPLSAPMHITESQTCNSADSDVAFHLFDKKMKNWADNQIVLTPIDASTATHSITTGTSTTYHYHLPDPSNKISSNSIIIKSDSTATGSYYNLIEHACLADGCYSLSALSTNNTASLSDMWHACGHHGQIPEYTQLCVDNKYNLCYGLDNCLYMKSYVHLSDNQDFTITYSDKEDDNDDGEMVILSGNIAGVSPLCDVIDGEYKLYIGGGNYYSPTDERNTVWICGQSFTLPYTGNLVISHNMTRCSTAPIMTTPITMDKICTMKSNDVVSSIPVNLMKLSVHGHGWGGDNIKYEIATASDSLLSQYYSMLNMTTMDDDYFESASYHNEQFRYAEDFFAHLTDDHDDMQFDNINHETDNVITTTATRITTTATTATTAISVKDDFFHIPIQYSDAQLALKPMIKQLKHNRQNRKLMTSSSSMRKLPESRVLATGTLSNGEFELDSLCLQVNKCYTFSMYGSTTNHGDDYLWTMCGYIGDTSTNIYHFCVTDSGCRFLDAPEIVHSY